MAELLIRAVDNHHKNLVKNQAGCYKEGDIVVVMPDGHRWGRCEQLHVDGRKEFYRLRVPFAVPESLYAYTACEISAQVFLASSNRQFRITRRRGWSIKYDLLPKREREQYLRGEIPNITLDEFKVACVRKNPFSVLFVEPRPERVIIYKTPALMVF